MGCFAGIFSTVSVLGDVSGWRSGLMDRVVVALVGSWGVSVISAATFPLLLAQNDGLVAVLLIFGLDVMLVRSMCVVGWCTQR